MIWPDARGVESVGEMAERLRQQGGQPLPGLGMQPGDPAYVTLRHASVLIPLLWHDDHWRLLYTRRTETVNSHKGQVSFPGGGAEPGDASPEDTALREAFEEIALRPDDVQVLGRLNTRPTISSFLVTPVVGVILWPYAFQLSMLEVSRVFTIPLAWLAQPENREERQRLVPTGTIENVVFYQPYEDEVVWGATARFTVDLLHILGLAE